MVAIYNQLNDVLCDVQDATITAHEFLSGNRKLTAEEQAEADFIKSEALTGYEEALKKATDEYNARKTLAERHDEEFEEVFEETYDYLKDAETYAEYMYKQFVSKIGRKIPKASVVSVTYTRPDGTTKTFILNYNAEAVEIDMGNDVVYEVAGLGYKIIEG
jgi:predicted methyltransferase